MILSKPQSVQCSLPEGKEVHRESDVDMTAKLTPCTRCLSSVFSVVKPKIKILKAKGAKLVTTSFDDLISIAKCTMFFTTECKEVHRESDVDMTEN